VIFSFVIFDCVYLSSIYQWYCAWYEPVRDNSLQTLNLAWQRQFSGSHPQLPVHSSSDTACWHAVTIYAHYAAPARLSLSIALRSASHSGCFSIAHALSSIAVLLQISAIKSRWASAYAFINDNVGEMINATARQHEASAWHGSQTNSTIKTWKKRKQTA